MYHVTIKKEVEKTTLTDRNWTTIEHEQLEDGTQKPIKGYTPQEEQRVIREVVVLDQMVEELDLPKVIAAVNGLELK
jgi:hypothetical protein